MCNSAVPCGCTKLGEHVDYFLCQSIASIRTIGRASKITWIAVNYASLFELVNHLTAHDFPCVLSICSTIVLSHKAHHIVDSDRLL